MGKERRERYMVWGGVCRGGGVKNHLKGGGHGGM